MKVSILNQSLESEYAKFLLNHPSKLIYYSIKYRDMICSTLSCSHKYLIAIENKKIKGLLPLMIKDGPYGKIINSLPFFGSHGGILYDDHNAKKALEDYYCKMLDTKDFSVSVIIQNPLLENNQFSKLKIDEKDHRIGQITSLRKPFSSVEEIMSDFHYKTRNMIRKAQKNGILIQVENDQIEILKNLHQENMQSINGKAKTDLFFDSLISNFDAGFDYDLYTAKINNKIVAALLIFYFGETIEYYMPVIDKEYRTFQPLSLIISTAMVISSQKGYKYWNWGGTWVTQDGVYRFKSRWGSVDYNYEYKISLFNKDIYNAKKKDLIDSYEGFYIIPHDKLKIK
tara:strand:+ start:13633 stop:14658 length:1026 start_codon:yes stop_codon:yes gene_type:complete